MGSARMAPAPMVGNIYNLFLGGYTYHSGQVCSEFFPYRELTGCLLYLSTHTRPDGTFSVKLLSCFMKTKSHRHWIAAKRILGYFVDIMIHVV